MVITYIVGAFRFKLSLGYYTFGHELAHNFGGHHDPDTSSNNIYTYGHGYLIPG